MTERESASSALIVLPAIRTPTTEGIRATKNSFDVYPNAAADHQEDEMNITATRIERKSSVMLPEVLHLERIEQRLREHPWHAGNLRIMAAMAGLLAGKRGQPA